MPYKLNPHTGKLDYYETGGTSSFVPLANFSTDANNSGTAETDLYSYTMPAGTMGTNNDTVTVRFYGTSVDNTNIKDVKFYFGGVMYISVNFVNAVGETKEWNIEAEIIRRSASVGVVKAKLTLFNETSVTYEQTYEFLASTAIDFTSALIIKVTGQSGTASNDVTAKMGNIAQLLAA